MRKKSRKASSEKQKKSSIKVKLPFISVLVALIVIGGYFFSIKYNQTSVSAELNNTPSDVKALQGGETRPTLSPALFTGKVAKAYSIAQQNRELLDNLYCYCNCKKSIGHKSLLSCFTDKHAVNCATCQNEALYASANYQKGDDILAVRLAVDQEFWKPLR